MEANTAKVINKQATVNVSSTKTQITGKVNNTSLLLLTTVIHFRGYLHTHFVG